MGKPLACLLLERVLRELEKALNDRDVHLRYSIRFQSFGEIERSTKVMSNFIPYGRQSISESDIKAVVDVLRSDFLTQGPVLPNFEAAVAEYCQAKHAVATTNATSALHLACLALGLGPGDRLWTSPITFVASANCALYCGAEVDFVDIDPRTYNLCPMALEAKLVEAEKHGQLPKVVVPVHMCGQSCDMQSIHALSQKYGFKIIEDASHAIGARYQGLPVGNGRYSDITIFSFHPVKIITTGEGGMAVTNHAECAKTMARLRSHGMTHDPADMMAYPNDEIWNYQQLELGFNYRMTELQAALGLSQLQRIDTFVSQRKAFAEIYNNTLRHLPILTPWQHPDCESSYHLYPLRIQANEHGLGQKEVYSAMHMAGIKVNLHYIPVYLQPFYAGKGFMRGYCPQAESYFKEVFSIPMYAGMSMTQQEKVCQQLTLVLKKLTFND
jgi:UDP-4-amino-4,6-dideoxy-N-acetyl-beta-L-altrosamine transaminase